MRLAMTAAILLFALSALSQAQVSTNKLGTWEGGGDQTTETFHVNAREWMVGWNVDFGTNQSHSFYIHVYRSSDKRRVASASSETAGKGYTIVHDGPGQYFIEVSTLFVERWQLLAEEPVLPPPAEIEAAPTTAAAADYPDSPPPMRTSAVRAGSQFAATAVGILVVLLLIAWILLPFAIIGIKSRFDKQIEISQQQMDLLRHTNWLLSRLLKAQAIDVEPAPPPQNR